MKPIAVLVTDTHFDEDNLEEVSSVLNQAVDLAVHLGCFRVRHCGDIFNDRTGLNLITLLALISWIQYAKAKGVLIEAIPGNHDKTDLEAERSYLSIYNFENFIVYERETIVEDDNDLHCFLPYFKENGTYLARLTKLAEKARKWSKGKIYLYTHIAVDGVRNNDGTKVENKLTSELFKSFTTVFVGHYHNASKIGNNIIYIGSGKPHNFGEDNEKGFTILYDNGEFELRLAQFKKFIPLKIDIDFAPKNEIKKLVKLYKNSDHNVRLDLTGSKENLESLDVHSIRMLGIDVRKRTKTSEVAVEEAKEGKKIEYNRGEILKSFSKFCLDNDISKKRKALGIKLLSGKDV